MNESPSPQPPAFAQGALLGALTMPALMALLALTHTLLGLPFLPLDVLDWLARALPGPLVTFGVDSLVAALLALGLGATIDSAAKLAEQIMALSLFWIAGLLLVSLLFALRQRGQKAGVGALLGLAAAVPLILILPSVQFLTQADPLLSAAWVLLVLVSYFSLMSRAYDALRPVPAPEAAQSGAALKTLDRRSFLIGLGGASAVLTVVGAGLSALLARRDEPELVLTTPRPRPDPLTIVDGQGNPLPNAADPLVPAPGTRPEYTPVADHYRIDINTRPVEIRAQDYRLQIVGKVENPVEWTLDEIYAMPTADAFITMACISNPIGGSLISTTKWTGVPMREVLARVKPAADAVALHIFGEDGFDEYLPLAWIEADERIMLCHSFDGAPLPVKNGFPLRVHIPDRYGMKQPKWITRIEVVSRAGEGYWVRRGWSADAFVRATSVIDTVAVDSAYERDGILYVPIGGIAWAGARGVGKVEVQVDDSGWQEAALRAPLSERTWVIWRYDWPFSEGRHRFTVRATEADGTPQIREEAPVRPDGATGYHSQAVTLRAPGT
ncbi:MAG: molybdopterin-dependent oxidoreductase [Anaerolineae bacterium]|nr:molybdopterin-dependent oxidoreductase [Anaerolineae bacterium]MDW8171265.1 molybdopterin-dependent oxidoreductase [Anaerolineae bacterium]